MSKRQATTRIIAGNYKGTKLTFKPNKTLRPTESKTKETLFNWLLNDLHEKRCLDMFAGTGALGLEALSRGAKEVVFFEKQEKSKINEKLIEFSDKIYYRNGIYDKLYYDTSLVKNTIITPVKSRVYFKFLDIEFGEPDSIFYFKNKINFSGGMWNNI